MLNSPDPPSSGAPGGGPQEPQPGSGGDQARPPAGQGQGGQPNVSYINVTAQEKEAIDRVSVLLTNPLISLASDLRAVIRYKNKSLWGAFLLCY